MDWDKGYGLLDDNSAYFRWRFASVKERKAANAVDRSENEQIIGGT
jgi:hypothetical protein